MKTVGSLQQSDQNQQEGAYGIHNPLRHPAQSTHLPVLYQNWTLETQLMLQKTYTLEWSPKRELIDNLINIQNDFSPSKIKACFAIYFSNHYWIDLEMLKSCGFLDKLLNLSEPQFFHFAKWELILLS